MESRKRIEPLPSELPRLATPVQLAKYLHPNTDSLAQMPYRGNGPKFMKVGRRVLYNCDDVPGWIAKNTIQRTDDPAG